MSKSILSIFALLIAIAFSCNSETRKKETLLDSNIVQGNLIVFHAASMTYSLNKIIAAYEQEFPHVNVIPKAYGSRTAALKIAKQNNNCDVLISSDYQVIKSLLIPDFAKWYISFAGDEMVIAYTDSSKKAEEINPENWYSILMSKEVLFGRSDPDSDPSGYRSVICIKLAENYYDEEGMRDNLLFKDKKFIKSKTSEIIHLLKSKKVDYIFTYKSIAQQKGFHFVELPEQINLSLTSQNFTYSTASVKVSSKKPGKYITRKGEAIRYALTEIKNSSNPKAAISFIQFYITRSKGLKLLLDNNISILDSLILSPQDSVPLSIQSKISTKE